MASSTWLECEDDAGRVFYFNEETRESQWSLPETLVVRNLAVSRATEMSPNFCARVNPLKESLEGAERERESLKSSLMSVSEEKAIVETELHELKGALQLVEEEKTALKEAHLSNLNRVVAKTEARKAEEAQILKLRHLAEINAKNAALRVCSRLIEESLEPLRTENEELKKTRKQQDEVIARLERRLRISEESLAEKVAQRTLATDSLSRRLESSLAEKNFKISELEEDLIEQRGKLGTSKQVLAQKTETVRKLEERNAKLRKRLDLLIDESEENKVKEAKLEASLIKERSRSQDLESLLRDPKNTNGIRLNPDLLLKNERDEAVRLCNTMKDKLEAAEDNIRELQELHSERQRMKEEVIELIEIKESLRKEKETAKIMKEQHHRDRMKLIQEKNALAAELQLRKSSANSRSKQIAILQKQVSGLAKHPCAIKVHLEAFQTHLEEAVTKLKRQRSCPETDEREPECRVSHHCRVDSTKVPLLDNAILMSNDRTLEILEEEKGKRRLKFEFETIIGPFENNLNAFQSLSYVPQEKTCTVLHGQDGKFARRTLFGTRRDPGLLAHYLFALSTSAPEKDLSVEIREISIQADLLVFRRRISSTTLSAAQSLVDLLAAISSSSPALEKAKTKKKKKSSKVRRDELTEGVLAGKPRSQFIFNLLVGAQLQHQLVILDSHLCATTTPNPCSKILTAMLQHTTGERDEMAHPIAKHLLEKPQRLLILTHISQSIEQVSFSRAQIELITKRKL